MTEPVLSASRSDVEAEARPRVRARVRRESVELEQKQAVNPVNARGMRHKPLRKLAVHAASVQSPMSPERCLNRWAASGLIFGTSDLWCSSHPLTRRWQGSAAKARGSRDRVADSLSARLQAETSESRLLRRRSANTGKSLVTSERGTQ